MEEKLLALGEKILVSDGSGAKLQQWMPYFLTRKRCLKIMGKVGKDIWGKH